MGYLFLCLLLVLAIGASFSESSAVSAVAYFFISFSSPNRKQTVSITQIQTCSEIIFDLPIASTVALYILLLIVCAPIYRNLRGITSCQKGQ